MSKILCVGKIGSRPASACEIISITTTTRISAPGRPQKPDFPPPALLVYEPHNEGRLGQKMKKTDGYRGLQVASQSRSPGATTTCTSRRTTRGARCRRSRRRPSRTTGRAARCTGRPPPCVLCYFASVFYAILVILHPFFYAILVILHPFF